MSQQDASMGVSRQTYSRDVTMQSVSQFSNMHTRARRSPLNGKATSGGRSGTSQSYQAPTGLTDSDDDSDGATPSFSIKAPTGYSESEDEDEVTSKPARPILTKLRSPSPAQEAMLHLNLRLQQQLLVSARKKTVAFRQALLEIEEQEERGYSQIQNQMEKKQETEAGELAARQAELSERQRELMSGLQKEHTVQAQAMDQQASAASRIAEAECEKAAREARIAAENLQADAEKKAAEAAEERRRSVEESKRIKEQEAKAMTDKKAAERIEEKKKAQEEADAQRRAQSQPGTASTSTPTNTTGQAGIRCAPQAAAFDKLCQDALSKAQEDAKNLDTDPKMKAEKRAIYRGVNKAVAQIGGTQHQVNLKIEEIVGLLNSLSGDLKAFAMLKLAQGFIDLSEGVESKFPVAEVAVAVCNAHPEATPVLLGKLHQTCLLTIPKHLVRLKGESADQFLQRWGYQRVEVMDKLEKRIVERWEDMDVFLQRLTSHVQFYAAFTQSEQQRVHGIQHAWSFLSRLLNALPPNRYTAFALLAFVEISGYRLHLVYRNQLVKLLMYVDQCFIEEIIQKGMEDARSAVRRLRQYLQSREFLKEPPGRKLEMYDASSYDRA